MFCKKDIIFSSGIGVCTVADIVNLSVNKSLPVQYYQLVSIYDRKNDSLKRESFFCRPCRQKFSRGVPLRYAS